MKTEPNPDTHAFIQQRRNARVRQNFWQKCVDDSLQISEFEGHKSSPIQRAQRLLSIMGFGSDSVLEYVVDTRTECFKQSLLPASFKPQLTSVIT